MAKHRLSVPVDPETLEVFQRMAQVMGKSLGSTISDWLTESRDTVEMVTVALMRAKESPARALRELQAIAEGVDQQLVEARGDIARQLTPSGPPAASEKRPAGREGAPARGVESRPVGRRRAGGGR